MQYSNNKLGFPMPTIINGLSDYDKHVLAFKEKGVTVQAYVQIYDVALINGVIHQELRRSAIYLNDGICSADLCNLAISYTRHKTYNHSEPFVVVDLIIQVYDEELEKLIKNNVKKPPKNSGGLQE